VFRSLRGYQRSWLRGDVAAGLTVWAVLVPEALAYASIAGVSPVVGLYAAPAALLLYAAFGSSRHLVTGPMSATAALSAAAVAQLATQGSDQFVQLTVALAITTGVAAVLAGLLRLGFLASFISEPVLKGFIIGLALTIVAGQLPKLFGVEGGQGDFFEKLWDLVTHLGDTHWPTLALGLVSLALVLGLRRLAPVVPGSLVAVLFGIVVVWALGLDDRGSTSSAISTAACRRSACRRWPRPTTWPWPVGDRGDAGRRAVQRHGGERQPVQDRRERLGRGPLPGLGAGRGRPDRPDPAVPQRAVRDAARGDPGRVVIAAVIELIDIPGLVTLYRVATRQLRGIYGVAARPDFLAALAALLGVLVFDTLPGLFIGIAVSLLLLLYRASRPHVAVLGQVPGADGHYGDILRHPENRQAPGIVVLRLESGLFFANADAVRDVIRAHAAEPGIRAVVLDAETIPYVDVTAARMLLQLGGDLEREDVRLVMARDIGQVRDVLRRTEEERLPLSAYPTVREAIAALTHRT